MQRKAKNIDVRAFISPDSPRFMDRLKLFIRSRGLAYSTEKTYIEWIRRFINFNGYQSPEALNLADVEKFLNYLANQRFCSPNTQATALNALVFLFREFLKIDTKGLSFTHARKQPKA